MAPIDVLILDAHPVYRNGLKIVLSSLPQTRVVGETTTGEEAVKLALDLQPHVVLMDLNIPDMNGIDATRRILQANPRIGILVITMCDDDRSVFASMRAGARGYLLKGADQDEVLDAIRVVAAGGAIFSPAVAHRLVHFFAGAKPPGVAEAFPELTEREQEILALIAEGLSNGEIADKLGLSGKTIRNNISNIFNKLQVTDRSQAIALAREAGLGS